jgi:hypothetical protein
MLVRLAIQAMESRTRLPMFALPAHTVHPNRGVTAGVSGGAYVDCSTSTIKDDTPTVDSHSKILTVTMIGVRPTAPPGPPIAVPVQGVRGGGGIDMLVRLAIPMESRIRESMPAPLYTVHPFRGGVHMCVLSHSRE